ncbi:uncharacterized protein LOC111707117 [Eurytemora carolleeae]|uniref:uncharacterized protein LOC111707117 n=1 Tax=Eurytemora carolleeae TaxID=1294199 RepID=UPI000C7909EB|nr:uncharacterized protein LOC111707117 [Eurytemora carolleeae]|eukprot:XP_023335888.1 uncharacterized protein LOC111707117 [Eurytemora affinis]
MTNTTGSITKSGDEGSTLEVLTAIFLIALCLSAAVPAPLTAWKFVKNPDLRTPLNIFKLNFLLGTALNLGMAPLRVFESPSLEPTLCLLTMVNYVTGLQSKLNILILEVDRFTAIQFPLVHYDVVTTRMSTITCIAASGVCLLVGLLVLIFSPQQFYCPQYQTGCYLTTSVFRYGLVYPFLVITAISAALSFTTFRISLKVKRSMQQVQPVIFPSQQQHRPKNLRWFRLSVEDLENEEPRRDSFNNLTRIDGKEQRVYPEVYDQTQENIQDEGDLVVEDMENNGGTSDLTREYVETVDGRRCQASMISDQAFGELELRREHITPRNTQQEIVQTSEGAPATEHSEEHSEVMEGLQKWLKDSIRINMLVLLYTSITIPIYIPTLACSYQDCDQETQGCVFQYVLKYWAPVNLLGQLAYCYLITLSIKM